MSNVEHVARMLAFQQSQAQEEKPMDDSPRWIDPPPPGLYRGIPFAQYASWDAANSSTLHLFERSAAHAREAMLNPDTSKAKEFGQAFHTAILEPDLLEERFVRGVSGDGRRTEIKKARAEVLERSGGRAVLLPEEWDDCLAMRDSVWSGPAAEILKGGMNEVSLVWKDEETGLLAKARLDHLGSVFGWSVIVDVKSSKNAAQGAFARDAASYAYHEQAAYYLDGANVLAPRQRRFLHLVVEKTRPFCTAIYELEDAAIEQGRKNYRKHLRQLAQAKATGEWPGYAPGITPLSLPRWAVSQEQESEA